MAEDNAREHDERDNGLREVMNERRQLLSLAYRLLGSLSEAEDAVQEAYARWYAMSSTERDAIQNIGAWLTRVASRVCLDQLRSARFRRERYVGEWVPEPLPGDAEWLDIGTADPADRVTLDESLSMAFLVVLESMTPAERVSFILHDVFRYPFDEIAEIVGRSAPACRQLASSARRRIRTSQPSPNAAVESSTIIGDFKRAWEAHDVEALIALLDPDATAVADGGGVASAELLPVHGPAQIARVLLEVAVKVPGLTLLERTVNGQPGLIARHDGVTVTVTSFEVVGDRIKRIWSVRNPDKLRPWTTDGAADVR